MSGWEVGWLLLIALRINKELLPVTGAEGYFPSTSHIPAATGCCCILPAVTYGSQVRVSSPWHSQCCVPSSPVPEGSAPPGLSCSTCPHPGLGKRLKTLYLEHTTWPSPSMPGTGTSQEAAAVSLSLLPVCFQVEFPSFLGGNRR